MTMAPPYRRGDVIIRSWPLVAIATQSDAKVGDGCSWCRVQRVSRFVDGSSSSTTVVNRLNRCSSCRHVFYCSTQCQRRDWHAHHRWECAYLERAKSIDAATIDKHRQTIRLLLLLGRADSKAGQQADSGDSQGEPDPEVTAAQRFFALDSHADDFLPIEGFVQQWHKLRAILRSVLAGNSYVRSLTDRQLLEIECRRKYETNKCSTFGTSCQPLCLEVASFAHSCDPSASIVDRGDGYVYVFANRAIESDADVTIAFESNLQTTKIRRAMLKLRYFIDCTCALCEEAASSSSPTRDDYLRSIRCSTTVDTNLWSVVNDDSGCSAPCPLTEHGEPAVEKCANGHRQEFHGGDLFDYYLCNRAFEFMQYEMGEMDDDDVHMRRAVSNPARSWMVLACLWHPINSHVLESRKEGVIRLPAADLPTFSELWLRSALEPFYMGMDAVGQEGAMKKLALPIDSVTHLIVTADALNRLMWHVVLPEYHPRRNQVIAIAHRLFRQMAAPAELFLGAENARAVTYRRYADMEDGQFSQIAQHWLQRARAEFRRTIDFRDAINPFACCRVGQRT